MAYYETDKGIVTSHNAPVNLPVKGQARGKTVNTIETSSEKINLSTCKGKIISIKGQSELEDFRPIFLPISSKASLPYQGLSAMFLDPSLEAHLPSE